MFELEKRKLIAYTHHFWMLVLQVVFVDEMISLLTSSVPKFHSVVDDITLRSVYKFALQRQIRRFTDLLWWVSE
jgi:hypothetical protein